MRTRGFILLLTILSLAMISRPALAESSVRVVELPLEGFVPDAEAGSDGVVHVAFVADTNLYYIQSTDNGRSFSPPLRVNPDEGNVHGGRYRGPDLALGADGRVHLVWYNQGYQRSRPQDQWGVEYAHLLSGATAFSGHKNLNHLPSDNFSVTADSTGRVAVFWTAGGLFANFSTNSGDIFSAAMPIGAGEIDPCECCATRCQFSTAGRLYLTYREKGDNLRDMHLVSFSDFAARPQEFTRSQISSGTWKIDACPMTGIWLAPGPRGGLLAAWENRTSVEFASFRHDSSPAAGSVLSAADKGNFPVILENEAGEILVAWKWKSDLFWKLYKSAADVSPVSGSQPGKSPDRPAGVVTAEGDFLLFP